MPDYHGAFRKLNAIVADAVDDLQDIHGRLINAQQQAEDILLDSPETEIRVLPTTGGTNKEPDPQEE